jgi:hypothetical protein
MFKLCMRLDLNMMNNFLNQTNFKCPLYRTLLILEQIQI